MQRTGNDVRPDWITTARARIHAVSTRPQADIVRLPKLASEYWSEEIEDFGWTPTLRTILIGVHDSQSTLAPLQGHEPTLVRHIFSNLASKYAKHLTLTIPASLVGHTSVAMVRFQSRQYKDFEYVTDILPTSTSPRDFVAFATCGHIKFPAPANRNVNMMPFIYGDPSSLPPELQCYQQCIEACPVSPTEIGRVFYLTVHESYVDPDSAQRREGLHIEAPGTIIEEGAAAFTPGIEHHWGCGVFFGADQYEGGIYMASSVESTSRIFDAIVDNSVPGIVDRHGGCEHLRPLMGHNGTDLNAGQLIWMTDRTPHEALPQKTAAVRQFFRLVTSDVSHWFAKHSTPNPKVPLPGHVIVVDEDKFATV
jgi:hypothetical protein